MISEDNYWDSIAEEYADEIMQIQPEFYKNTSKLINEALENCRMVLDIGNGGVINYKFDMLTSLDCADLAISKTTIKRYSQYDNIKFINADIMDMKETADNTYDAVIVQTVLHHLAGKHLNETHKNVEKAIRECIRVLKPNGKLLIVESTVNRFFEAIERLFYLPMQVFFKVCKFDSVYQYSAGSLIKRIQALGFDINSTQDIALDRYIWIMRKKILTSITPCGAVWIEIKKGGY